METVANAAGLNFSNDAESLLAPALPKMLLLRTQRSDHLAVG
jgi:hypothetical protein